MISCTGTPTQLHLTYGNGNGNGKIVVTIEFDLCKDEASKNVRHSMCFGSICNVIFVKFSKHFSGTFITQKSDFRPSGSLFAL